MAGLVMVPIAVGELIDKITILEIKQARIVEPAKLANVNHELAALTMIAARLDLPDMERGEELKQQLRAVNEAIWDAENIVRDHDRRQDFGPAFAQIARTTYRNNDRRALLKRELSLLAGSTILEEKSHTASGGA